MSNLKSGPTTPQPIILEDSSNFRLWDQQLSTTCETSFGAIGRNIANNTREIDLKHKHLGNKPSELDERLNPYTGKPEKDSLKYLRHKPAAAPADEASLSDDDRLEAIKARIFSAPLQAESHKQYYSDLATHDTATDKHNAEIANLRKLDDETYRYIISTVSSSCQTTIKTNPKYDALKKRPDNYFYRSRDYIELLRLTYSTGSVRLIVSNILTCMNIHQSNTTLAEHLQTFLHLWNATAASLEDPLNPGFVPLHVLKFAFLSNSIDRTSPSNHTAINNYYQKHDDVMLPEEFIQELIKTNVGNLADRTDPTSLQGSALLASPSSTSSETFFAYPTPSLLSFYIFFNISITMTDIAEIQLKIKAVEFILVSFTKYRNEEERVAFLHSQLETVRFLDVYSDFTKDELKDALNKQQDEKNLLLEKENKQQDEKNLLLEKENLLLAQLQGAKLGDGLPELVRNLTLSPPSVPAEKEHASCLRTVGDLSFSIAESVNISGSTNTIWRKALTRADSSRYLLYSSEDDIVYFVRRFMEDILLALGLSLDFNAEVTIKQTTRPLRPLAGCVFGWRCRGQETGW